MQNFLLAIVLAATSLTASATGRLDVGLGYYGLIDQTQKINSVSDNRVYLEDRTRMHHQSVEATIGVAYQWKLTEVFGFEFASWYLGHPKLETESTYRTNEGVFEYQTDTFRNYQVSMQYQFSARLLFIDDTSHFLLGSSRIMEFYDDKEQEGNGFDFGLFSMNSYGRRTKDHVAVGLLKDINITTDIKGSIRWQHLYSVYGPIEVVSLSLRL